MADLDALLDEAADAIFKPEPPKRKVDPPEVKPWLAATALVTPALRDEWSALVRKDHEVVIKSKFLPSKAYQSGDAQQTPLTNANKLLFEQVKNAATRCGLDDVKTNKLLSVVNPVTDNETGKRIQAAYRKQLLKSLKKDIVTDVNYSPEKFPNLAAALSNE
jgi:hypothetical protein